MSSGQICWGWLPARNLLARTVKGTTYEIRKDVLMLIRLGYDLTFQVPSRTAMLLMLYVHPSQASSLLEADRVQVEPYAPVEEFIDGFGNRCGRVVVSPGKLRLWSTTLIEDSGT